ncbi:MAG: hypothetical protein KGD67_12395, partial [Candidatus Lokiarchaeota archaeon]|nr:hypothetical protein [Candidatus Lokiarchaeota archaeon]
AEAMVAGAYSITSGVGALSTTNMGTIIEGYPDKKFFDEMVDVSVDLLQNQDVLEQEQERVKKEAIKRFHPDRIIKEWENKVFK